MYISSLKMERFGVWADLRLSSFSEGLNVIYGPNGSGKTTVVRFIGAMLYGFGDEVRHRYLPADAQAGGALTVQGSFGRRTILRRDDGPGNDRLIVENEDAAVGGMHRLQDLLGGVRQGVFERVFQVEFQGDLDIDKLIQTALAEGFDLLGSHAESDRVAELQDRLQSKRQALAEITTAEIAFDELVRRRRGLQQEAESLQASLHDHRASWERRLGQLDANIVDLEEQVESLEEELRSVSAQIEARQADRQGREASLLDARQRQLQLETQRRQGLREIDTQLERWRGVLQDLEDRSRRLRDQAGFAPGLELRADTDPRRYLRRLEDGLDRLQRSVAELATAEPGSASAPRCAPPCIRRWPSCARTCTACAMNSAIGKSVRSSATTTANSVSCSGAKANCGRRWPAWPCSVTPAGRIGGQRRRRAVALPPDRAGLCHCQQHPRPWTPLRAAPTSRCRTKLLHWDAELRRLIARRDMIRDDLSTLEDELRDFRDQRRQVALECDPEFEEHRLKAKQQELDGIEVNLRQFERRRELMAAVTKLEDELRALTRSPHARDRARSLGVAPPLDRRRVVEIDRRRRPPLGSTTAAANGWLTRNSVRAGGNRST